MIDIRDKRVMVVGTGKSGVGSAVLLERNGALPVIYDGNDKTDIEAVKASLQEKLGHETRAVIYTGAFLEKITDGIDDLKGTIIAYREPGGNRYIKIKTDNDITYNKFSD